MWNLKKYNKLVDKTKKDTHRCREQTNGYQKGERSGEGQDTGWGEKWLLWDYM